MHKNRLLNLNRGNDYGYVCGGLTAACFACFLTAACFACFLTAANARLNSPAFIIANCLFWIAIPILIVEMFGLLPDAEIGLKKFKKGLNSVGVLAAMLGFICFVFGYSLFVGLVCLLTTLILSNAGILRLEKGPGYETMFIKERPDP